MAVNDTLSNALTAIKNAENAAKKECFVRPASKLLGKILELMKKNGYIASFELIEDGRDNTYKISLKGVINECKTIKPRYSTKKDEFEKFEKRFLPAKDIGIIIVTTSKGILTHREAKEKGLGGKLLAYIY
jgi:small subunit ribosomal protein S8